VPIEDLGGWGIAVSTERLGGGRPLIVIYAVAFTDEAEARRQVTMQGHVLPGDEITNAHPLSKTTIQMLKLDAGDVALL
jgi:hypothetical protein